jgi:transcriptional regulator with XRE-family HTH domain
MDSKSLDRKPVMTFGERLRDARSKAQVSQSDLARTSGVPKTMLSRYENDHILPSITTLRKLALALEIPESGLLVDNVDAVDVFAGALAARGVSFDADDASRLAQVVADLVDANDVRVRFLSAAQQHA